MAGVVVGWALLGALPCLVLLAATIALVRRCPRLADARAPDPDPWPVLSVVVAARDEADTIGPALASLLAQDYPALEVVVVDDRSGDGTGAIVDRVAARDSRLRAVHVAEVPSGWLGKVHALARGVERARGAWVLFTDADVHFAPGTLRRAVAWAEANRLDHLSVLAEAVVRSFWAGVCHASMLRSLLALARPWEAADPRSRRAIGTGAFNLVRRVAFDRTPGFEWLRLEVADDIGLGLMMKRAGARSGFLLGRGQLVVAWYPTLALAARGLEKNGFAQAARFSLWRGMGLAVLGVVGAFGVFAAFVPVGVPWLPAVGAVALCSHVASAAIGARALGYPLLHGLLSLPLGDVVMSWIVLRATLLGVRRGGAMWRGTVYPTALLRAGRRVDM
jgi:glycosyltransferase involved in cell wall biosynthesis